MKQFSMAKKLISFGCVLLCVPIYSVFEYDSVALSAQRGEWEKAQEKIQPLLVTHHDSPDLLYDAGVASYKLKQYEQAVAYFEHAAQAKSVDKILKERALFNAGNAHVALHNLEQAISLYEQVLAHNPTHEKAKHNLEKVKEMLAQKEQEQEQEKEQEKDNSPDKQKGQQKDSQQKDSQQKDSGKSDKKDGQQGNQSPETGDQGQEVSDGKGQQQGNQSAGADNKQGNQEQGEQDKADAQHDHKGDDKEQSEAKPGDKQNNNAQKNSSNHTGAPEKSIEENFQSPAAQAGKAGRVTTKDMTKQESAQDGAESAEGPQDTPEQRWLARVLDERDGAETQASKNLMKSVMGKQLGGTHGKKCW